MANINIYNLNPAGSELLIDSGSYLNALSADEIMRRWLHNSEYFHIVDRRHNSRSGYRLEKIINSH